MTTTAGDIEELETTKSEKLLAVVLTAFLLLGGVWTYQRIDDDVRARIEVSAGSPADRGAVARAERARQRLFSARAAADRARREVEFRREEYRAALDADRPAAPLERRYRAAQTEFETARREERWARQALAAAEPAARAARDRIADEQRDDVDRRELVTFALRLGLVLTAMAVGYWLLSALRRRNSRYLPVAGSVLSYATILAFVLGVDYLTDYFDPFDYGIVFVAALGVGATLAAFYGLQRYLVRRLPYRRVRKGECPFCAFPVRGNRRCEGCGREVVAACSTCEAPRRVGARHCGACGAA